MLAAYDVAPEGEKGALLRRKGLYSSHSWSGAGPGDAGALAGLSVPRADRGGMRAMTGVERDERELEPQLASSRLRPGRATTGSAAVPDCKR